MHGRWPGAGRCSIRSVGTSHATFGPTLRELHRDVIVGLRANLLLVAQTFQRNLKPSVKSYCSRCQCGKSKHNSCYLAWRPAARRCCRRDLEQWRDTVANTAGAIVRTWTFRTCCAAPGGESFKIARRLPLDLVAYSFTDAVRLIERCRWLGTWQTLRRREARRLQLERLPASFAGTRWCRYLRLVTHGPKGPHGSE